MVISFCWLILFQPRKQLKCLSPIFSSCMVCRLPLSRIETLRLQARFGESFSACSAVLWPSTPLTTHNWMDKLRPSISTSKLTSAVMRGPNLMLGALGYLWPSGGTIPATTLPRGTLPLKLYTAMRHQPSSPMC
jgi:hypothetical protein